MVRDAPSSEDLESYWGEQLAGRIEALRHVPPTIGPMAMGRIDDQQGERRQIGPGHTIPTNRWYARYKVDGDRRLLERWPDADDPGLRTVDHELMERIGGYDALRTASRSAISQLLVAPSDAPSESRFEQRTSGRFGPPLADGQKTARNRSSGPKKAGGTLDAR